MAECYKLDCAAYCDMLACGFAALGAREEEINKLNVFPVPDGDTGKNMRMTYESGLKKLKEEKAEDVASAADIFAKGMLMGARGNSGVILSQIFRGIATGLSGCAEAGADDIIRAFGDGVKRSYKAVVKPVEGTMLTVFRECSDCAAECSGKDVTLNELFKNVKGECEISLKNTPELLSVLKDAGVVDSGGAGLLCIFDGFLSYFNGAKAVTDVESSLFTPADMSVVSSCCEDGEEFGYCTEFLISLNDEAKPTFSTDEIVNRLQGIGGQSIVALRDGDIVKVHVHVLTPGDVLNIAQCYGEFISIKIENMTLQHTELLKEEKADKAVKSKERVNVALVTVADGGFADLFYNMGADYVVSGGQSMNPSVEDFVKAFDAVNADSIIVLPNNSNITMAVKQAAGMYKASKICPVPTKTLAQGYSALSIYNPDEPLNETLESMNSAVSSVMSTEITHAVRDAVLDGVNIIKGDIIAISDGIVVASEKSCLSALETALSKAKGIEDKCVVTLFCGSDSDEETINAFGKFIASDYPALELSVVKTAQAVYDYIMALE